VCLALALVLLTLVMTGNAQADSTTTDPGPPASATCAPQNVPLAEPLDSPLLIPRDPAQLELHFDLPDYAYGQQCWVNISFSLGMHELGPNLGPDSVEAETNGFAVLKAYVSADQSGMTVNAGTLIAGNGITKLPSSDGTVTLENYTQDTGVHPGRNTLSLRIVQEGTSPVANTSLLSGTHVDLFGADPNEIQLTSSPVMGATGHEVKLPFHLSSRGLRPDGSATVHLILPEQHDAVTVVGPDTQTFTEVGDGVDGYFSFQSTASVDLPVMLHTDRYNSPTASTMLQTRQAAEKSYVPSAVMLVAGLLLLAGLAPFRWLRAKARRRAAEL
jgi:hypothetical protein